jgi:hypothetical protein
VHDPFGLAVLPEVKKIAASSVAATASSAAALHGVELGSPVARKSSQAIAPGRTSSP